MSQHNKTPLLVIEDEPEIRNFLKTVLTEHQYEPLFAETAKDGEKLVNLHRPDMIILDLGLPDKDGLDVIKTLREWTQVPILVLSARFREKDKVSALDLGADDYMTKPFGVGELLARLKVIQRRTHQGTTNHSSILTHGDLKIDVNQRQVWQGAIEIQLTPTEYKMLRVFLLNAGKVVTNQHLLREVWGKNADENNHYLRIYVQHLRRKLNDDPMTPKYIVTEPGVGYRLKN